MTENERKLLDHNITLSTTLATIDSEAQTYRRWFYDKSDEVKKLEAENARLTAELANLRETGTIVVHDKANSTYDGHTPAEIRDMAAVAVEKIDALSGTQEG